MTLGKLASTASVLSLFQLACSATDMEEPSAKTESAESESQSIVNGTDLTDQQARNSGLPILNGGCTGTLLNSRWILTAAHCFANNDSNGDGLYDSPQDVPIRFGNNADTTAESRQAQRILKHPSGYWGSAGGVDAALIELSSDAPSMTLPTGHFTNGRMLVYSAADANLVGATMTSMGYGKNVAQYGAPYTGHGTLRRGQVRVSGTGSTIDTVPLTASDGLLCNGDSGGPLFLDIIGNGGLISRYVAGIASTSNCQTWSSYTAPEQFRPWVEQTVWGASSAAITCTGTSCSSTPVPLPNNASAYRPFAPWGAAQNSCYYVSANFQFEQSYDFVNIGNGHLSGNGSYGTHWCGALPLSLTTDYSVQSNGLTSLVASHHTTANPPSGAACVGNGSWTGCRGTGCHACIELLSDYPKYFENHPNCAPNNTCAGSFYTCSTNCPAPTNADK